MVRQSLVGEVDLAGGLSLLEHVGLGELCLLVKIRDVLFVECTSVPV